MNNNDIKFRKALYDKILNASPKTKQQLKIDSEQLEMYLNNFEKGRWDTDEDITPESPKYPRATGFRGIFTTPPSPEEKKSTSSTRQSFKQV